MKKFGIIMLKILEIILAIPFAFLGGCIIALFIPFALVEEVINDILYN